MALSAQISKPSDLGLKALSSSEVLIRWRDNSDSETGYKIFRDGELIMITAANVSSFIDRDLLPSHTYRYTVKATDDKIDKSINHIYTINMRNSNSDVTFSMNGNFVSGSHPSFFIDSDGDPSTGYTRGAIKGADYLAQDNKTLYRYIGPGWKWELISDKVKYYFSSTYVSFTIPLEKIGSPVTINYTGRVSSKNWNRNHDYASMKKAVLNTRLPILIIGPSTVYIGSELNEAVHPDGSDCRLEGWGQRFYFYAKDHDAVYDYARPGSSSTDFPEPPDGKSADVQTLYGPNRDHYWEKVVEKMEALKKGILLIQYGANEPSTTDEVIFKANIQRYIDKAKELNFIPVLITEIEKRKRDNNGILIHSRGDYPKWMKEIGAENNLQVLDLNTKSYQEYSKYSDKEWDRYFTDCLGRWNHKKQDTHYEAKGAKSVASWIRDLACKDKNSKLCKQLILGTPASFVLHSSNFIPEHGSPVFSWEDVPKGTKSFVLIIDDYDAKDGTLNWVHWSLINIDKNIRSIKRDRIPEGSKVGINSNGFRGYAEPKFPHQHKYVAHLYALDTADVTNAKFFNGARHFSLEKKYDHKEFEKIFGLFILDKAEVSSK